MHRALITHPMFAVVGIDQGGTFEEKDVSKWAQEEVKRHLLEVAFESADGNTELSISEVTKVDGDANIWVVRGKKR